MAEIMEPQILKKALLGFSVGLFRFSKVVCRSTLASPLEGPYKPVLSDFENGTAPDVAGKRFNSVLKFAALRPA
jgi:hypothetical protein